MKRKVIYLILFFGISLFVLAPYIVYKIPLVSTMQEYIKQSIALQSYFIGDNSIFWVSNSFGMPHFSDPHYIYYSPFIYLHFLLNEPFLGYVLWLFGLFIALWGAYQLFNLFFKKDDLAFLGSILFVFAHVPFYFTFKHSSVVVYCFFIWTIYLVVLSVQKNQLNHLILASFIHGQNFLIISGNIYIWIYLTFTIFIYLFFIKFFSKKSFSSKKELLISIIKNN